MSRILWLVEWEEWDKETRWDMHSEFVVCCATEAEARDTHPGARWDSNYTWIARSETAKLRVTPLGVAYAETPQGVLCSSFHAG